MVRFLKRMLSLLLINLVVVFAVYLFNGSLTIYNLGHGIYIGGIVMVIMSGLCILGAVNSMKANVRTDYIMSANGGRKGNANHEYISERNKNTKFSLLLFITGLFSIFAGYAVGLL